MESKYKVGDKVRVKSLGWYYFNKDEKGNVLPHHDKRLFFPEEMSEDCGKEFEIMYVFFNEIYLLKGNEWMWEDWMFEGESKTKGQQVLEQIERVQQEIDKLRLLYNS